MKALFSIQLAVMAIMAIPVIGVFAWGYDITRWANTGMGLNTSEGTFTAPPELPSFTLPGMVLGMHEKRRIERVFGDDLGTGRTVSLTQRYPFEAILRPGEAPPPDHLRRLWVTARAPAMARALCEEVVGPLARSCDVLDAEAVPNGDEVVATVRLAFLPVFDVGPLSEAEGASLYRAGPLPIVGPGRPGAPTLRDDALGRAMVYAIAAGSCAGVRAEFGNCVPVELRMRSVPAEGGAVLAAELTVAVHAVRPRRADMLSAAARAD